MIISAIGAAESKDDAKALVADIKEVCDNMDKLIDTMLWGK